MKTVEEMRVAVLAECEILCPQHMMSTPLWGNLVMFRDSETFEIIWGGDQFMVINIYSSDDAFIAAYRLLGLSEREAVAAANSRAQKAIQACADYAQSVYVAKDLTIKELEAKNAALVAALEAIKQEHGYRYTYGDGFGNVVEKRINSVGVAVDKALAANEKGGKGE